MWQKCPICNGTGVHNNIVVNTINSICKTCNGHGIISESTGLPPIKPKQKDENLDHVIRQNYPVDRFKEFGEQP